MSMDSKSKQEKILVIIPAYNEEGSIVAVVNQVKESGYDYIVVNDGSTDGTQKICQANGINVINLSHNLGIGGAVQVGHKFASRMGYDIDVQIDGDGQHDISYIPYLIEGINLGNDLVIGSRFLEETQGFKSTFMRRVGIKWLSVLIRLLCSARITDPTSGLRASSKKMLDYFSDNYPSDYPEPESIVSALRSEMRVVEVSVQMNERTEGKSSIGIFDSIYYMVKVTLAILIDALSGSRKKRT